MQRDIFCFCVETDRKLQWFKLLFCNRVQLAVVVNKSGFVHPETWNQNWQHQLPETLAGEESIQIFLKRPADRKKNVACRPETTCLSVNDINSWVKSNIAAAYCLETARKNETKCEQTWRLWEKGLWMKKLDIIMSAGQMNVH